MLSQDVKQRINTARQILVGKVPDPKAQVEQITTALIYKFMDDMDQQNEMLGESHNFLWPAKRCQANNTISRNTFTLHSEC